jgi:hypothetical protein
MALVAGYSTVKTTTETLKSDRLFKAADGQIVPPQPLELTLYANRKRANAAVDCLA